jgi:hypothetical protein
MMAVNARVMNINFVIIVMGNPSSVKSVEIQINMNYQGEFLFPYFFGGSGSTAV